MIHARLLVEREVVQGKRDEEAFNRVFGQSLYYSSLSFFSLSLLSAPRSRADRAAEAETIV